MHTKRARGAEALTRSVWQMRTALGTTHAQKKAVEVDLVPRQLCFSGLSALPGPAWVLAARYSRSFIRPAGSTSLKVWFCGACSHKSSMSRLATASHAPCLPPARHAPHNCGGVNHKNRGTAPEPCKLQRGRMVWFPDTSLHGVIRDVVISAVVGVNIKNTLNKSSNYNVQPCWILATCNGDGKLQSAALWISPSQHMHLQLGTETCVEVTDWCAF